MYFLYIIESDSTGKWYIGSTNDVEKRLAEHNAGKTRSTKAFIPYRLVYKETFETKTEALKRERLIKKSGRIRKELREQINKAPSSIG